MATRLALVALLAFAALMFSSLAFERAYNYEQEDHIITTIDGQTLDCVRKVELGDVYYEDCEEVYAP